MTEAAQEDVTGMPTPKQDDRTPGLGYTEIETEVRKIAMSLPPSDFGSTRAIQAVARWVSENFAPKSNAYGSTDALREALVELLAATIEDAGDGSDCPGDDGPVALYGDGTGVGVTFAIIRKAIAALSGSPAPSTEGLREALALYEQAVVHAEAVLGGEYADFDGPFYDIVCKARDAARTALAGVTAPQPDTAKDTGGAL